MKMAGIQLPEFLGKPIEEKTEVSEVKEI